MLSMQLTLSSLSMPSQPKLRESPSTDQWFPADASTPGANTRGWFVAGLTAAADERTRGQSALRSVPVRGAGAKATTVLSM